jgi:hypothetical protein
VPLQALVDKFSHVRFEPSGMTRNPRSVREVDRRLHLPVDGVGSCPTTRSNAGVNGRELDSTHAPAAVADA